MRINFKLHNTNFPFRNAGFTLIELLVVITTIAILSGISIFALNNARQSGRDAKRRADLAQIAQGFELFKADCNFYPNTKPAPNSPLTGVSPCSPVNSNRYIEAVPGDPDPDKNYIYAPTPDGCSGNCTGFKLWAALESPPNPIPGYCGGTPTGCGGPTECDFCVINP